MAPVKQDWAIGNSRVLFSFFHIVSLDGGKGLWSLISGGDVIMITGNGPNQKVPTLGHPTISGLNKWTENLFFYFDFFTNAVFQWNQAWKNWTFKFPGNNKIWNRFVANPKETGDGMRFWGLRVALRSRDPDLEHWNGTFSSCDVTWSIWIGQVQIWTLSGG